jgi:hypothetical protein
VTQNHHPTHQQLKEARKFQPAALAIETDPLPKFARSTIYVLVAVVVAFIGWAAVAKIDR